MNERKTFEEWKALYKKKTGKEFERNKAFKLFFFPERGFCEIKVTEDMVMAYQLCGDGWFWRRMIEMLAMSLGYTHCGAICLRHIKPYIRLWGGRIERTEKLPDGNERYYCVDDYGWTATASPAFIDNDTGKLAYYFTWEVKGYGI